MRIALPLYCLLLLQTFFAHAQGKWELRRNENGITVYTRTPLKGNLKELHVVCELDATEEQLIAALMDINSYTNWVYSNKKSYILKKVGPLNVIYYTQARLLWPIKDRDLVVELNIDQNKETKELNIQAKGLPTFLPVNDKFVRVPYSLAQWKVVPIGENKLKVDYTFSVDPGGSIPSWLVNATLAIGPYNSFARLKETLKIKK